MFSHAPNRRNGGGVSLAKQQAFRLDFLIVPPGQKRLKDRGSLPNSPFRVPLHSEFRFLPRPLRGGFAVLDPLPFG